MDRFRGTTTGDGWGLDGADLVGIGCSGFDGGRGRLDGEDLMIFCVDWARRVIGLAAYIFGVWAVWIRGDWGGFSAWNGSWCGIETSA